MPTGCARFPIGWLAFGLGVIGFGAALTYVSPRFGYAYEVVDMPVLALAGGLLLAGLVYALCLVDLIHAERKAGPREAHRLILWVLASGLAARLILFASEPILEDDYQRYLWDGAVTAHGLNPYAVAPEEAAELDGGSELARLARESGLVLERVNHPEFRTVYPPVAQGAFALAHLLRPWSLTAWRSLILACDLATLALILVLLGDCGRSPLWSALYWWNPLVLKELFNSAHMEAVVLPLVLLALWLGARRRNVLAAGALAFAAGAKIWPALLLPLVLRPIVRHPRRLVIALLVFSALAALLAAPVLLAPMDEGSGFAAYTERWRTNSALFPMIEGAAAMLLDGLGTQELAPGLLARGVIALLLGFIALVVCREPITTPGDLVGRAGLVIGALVLLSPAQFPWYALWFAPLLAFRPWMGFLLLSATIPLYYAGFHFIARDQREVLGIIALVIWLPVWSALGVEALRGRPWAVGSRQ